MLPKRLAQRLDAWLERAANGALPAFHSFVARVRRDYSAVKAGLSLPWRQGQFCLFYLPETPEEPIY